MSGFSIKIVSKTQQVRDFLKTRIDNGELKPGDNIMSEQNLAKSLGVSLITVRAAVSSLVEEGFIYRIHGKGTFVADFTPKTAGTKTLAVMVYHVDNPFYSQIIRGMETEARKRGYHLLLCNTGAEEELENKYAAELINSGKIDGIMVSPENTTPNSGTIKKLRLAGMPFVVFPQFSAKSESGINYVVCDDENGAYLAVNHLLSLGHKQVGFLSRPIAKEAALNNRLNGYKRALKNASVTFDQKFFIKAREVEQEDGFKAAFAFAAMKNRPDAVFAIGDSLAIGFISGLRECGLRVPEDVAIVGFDDIPLAAQTHIRLSTIAQPTYEIGRKAVEVLTNQIEGKKDTPRQVVLPARLVVRATCGSDKIPQSGKRAS